MKVGDYEVLIGADPEAPIRDAEGKFVSAWGLIPGTKEEPHKVPGGAVQVDGMAVEYNIDPASTEDEFVENNVKVIEALSKMLPDHELVLRSAVEYSDEVWKDTPKEAKILGCDPDMNAYTMMDNPAPDAKATFRTFSGHIHIGWTNGMDIEDPGHKEACSLLVKELETLIGVGACFLDNNYDSVKRKRLYGKAGTFRIKPYGVEIRSPSNFWLKDEKYMRWVYQMCIMAFGRLLDETHKQDTYNLSVYLNDIDKGLYRMSTIEKIKPSMEFELPKGVAL